jgi:predicted CoA-binding protein
MKRIAIIGASNDRTKYGNRAVRAYAREGYMVYPVNPREREIEGIKAYASVRDLPERPERVSIYVRPEVTLQLLSDIVARGCDELWLNPGAESAELVAAAERLGLKVVQACSLMALDEPG